MQASIEIAPEIRRTTLADARIVKLVFFVSDLHRSRLFYEEVLNLQLLHADQERVCYETGQIVLELQRWRNQSRTLPPRDRSADLTFLVDDLDNVRDALSARGVKMTDTLRYEIGSTVDFYDPDGHWMSLYEPSPAAMTWPSANKLRSILRAGGKKAELYGVVGPKKSTSAVDRLRGRELVYLFTFIPDPEGAFNFYNGVLGLRYLERRPCRRGTTEHPCGVVKYDNGGLMLSTHYRDAPTPEDTETAVTQRLCLMPVFHVPNLLATIEQLAGDGVSCTPPGEAMESTFSDPFGRRFQLIQVSSPSRSPFAAKVSSILAAEL